MSSKQTVLDHLVRQNQEYLDFYKVVIRIDDIDFGDPVPGNYEGGANTQLSAMMRSHHRVKGGNTYYYSRIDMQEAFAAIGYSEVPCAVEGTADIGKVIVELQNRYNFKIDMNEIIDVQQSGDDFSFGVTSKSYVWLGRLTVKIVDGYGIPLAVALPNNVLDGLTPPDYSG